jgi:hypothetical protein
MVRYILREWKMKCKKKTLSLDGFLLSFCKPLESLIIARLLGFLTCRDTVHHPHILILKSQE